MKRYLLLGGLLLIGIIAFLIISPELKYSKFRSEIERVAEASGVQPSSVECRNVEFAPICYAKYPSLSSDSAKQMLTKSGYTLVNEQYNQNGEVSATNQAKSIRVDSENYSSSGSTYELKFKDIEVTL